MKVSLIHAIDHGADPQRPARVPPPSQGPGGHGRHVDVRVDLQRHAHEPLLDRVWALRKNLTAYDAVYVALAEVLDGVLLTCDRRLSQAPGMGRRVVLIETAR